MVSVTEFTLVLENWPISGSSSMLEMLENHGLRNHRIFAVISGF